MTQTNENAIMNLDSLLDGTLDDLADAPSFKPFAAGVHRVVIKWDATKKINDIPAIELSLKHMETVELKDPTGDKAPEAGDETSTSFMLFKKDKDTGKLVINEMGQGQWKELLAMLKKDLGIEAATNREVMEATQNMECTAVTTIRADKRDKDNIKYYTGVTSLNTI